MFKLEFKMNDLIKVLVLEDNYQNYTKIEKKLRQYSCVQITWVKTFDDAAQYLESADYSILIYSFPKRRESDTKIFSIASSKGVNIPTSIDSSSVNTKFDLELSVAINNIMMKKLNSVERPEVNIVKQNNNVNKWAAVLLTVIGMFVSGALYVSNQDASIKDYVVTKDFEIKTEIREEIKEYYVSQKEFMKDIAAIKEEQKTQGKSIENIELKVNDIYEALYRKNRRN